jgi:hypothetical protein
MFISKLKNHMISASKQDITAVMIGVHPDIEGNYLPYLDFVIRKNVKSDYMDAADLMNSSNIDVVELVYEPNAFGGEGDYYITQLIKRLKMPVIVTIYNFLDNPPEHYLRNLKDLCDHSIKIIAMDTLDIMVLKNVYGIPLNKIKQIENARSRIFFELKRHVHQSNISNNNNSWANVGKEYMRLTEEILYKRNQRKLFSYAPTI